MLLIKKLHFVVECSPVQAGDTVRWGPLQVIWKAFTSKDGNEGNPQRISENKIRSQTDELDWKNSVPDYIVINHWNYSISLTKLKELSTRNTGANSCSEVWDQLAGLSGSRLKAAEWIWRRVSVWDGACPLVHSVDESWTAGRAPGTILGAVGRAGTVPACRRSRSAAADPRFLLASHFHCSAFNCSVILSGLIYPFSTH